MLVESCLKQILKQDRCLEWPVVGWDPWQWLTPGASKESERTPVWKAPVQEELPIDYLGQTLKQKGFYLFNMSKVTLNAILTKSLWQTIVFQESPLRSSKGKKKRKKKTIFERFCMISFLLQLFQIYLLLLLCLLFFTVHMLNVQPSGILSS